MARLAFIKVTTALDRGMAQRDRSEERPDLLAVLRPLPPLFQGVDGRQEKELTFHLIEVAYIGRKQARLSDA